MATAPPAPNETSVLIMGHRVAFPAGKSPFPAQLAVMSSTLSALNRKQHALVESPTGSGKTLALLSSCLTFQRDIVRQEFAELQHRQVETAQQQTQQTKQGSEWDDDAFELLQRSVKRVKREADNTAAIIADDEAIENLQQVQDLAQEYSQQESHEESQQTQESAAFGPDDLQQQQQSEVITPRIYFCSRTHSQLAQVVKELKGCPESYMATPDLPVKLGETTLRSCVLGSKRVMCVNEEVNDEPSLVNARCQELRMEKERKMANAKNEEEMDEAGCPYSQTSFSQLRQRLPQIWDIEDVTKTAPSCKECAYFFSKNLLEKAHIVFCPYNYILDPSIRKAVGITLHNSIVVLDEAHNVEDTCRSGASLELTDNILAASIKSFDDVLKQETHIMIPEAYDAVRYALSYVKTWFNTNEDLVRDPGDPDEDDCYMLWSTEDALAMLRECGLAEVGESDMDQIVQNQQMMMNSPGTKILLNSLALSTATRVISVASYMLRSNGKDADDFKVVITKKRRRTEDTEIIDTKLCIWCLSAAVVFSDVAFQARSVILASGTLSPMDSFAGELGVDFPIRLEANHVVNMRKQVFVGARNRIEMPTLGPAPAQEPVPALIPAFTSTTGTSGSPLVLEYEENASIKNEPRSWSGEVKFEPLAVPGEYGLAPVPTFLSAVGTADAPIELEDEDLTTIKYESQGGIASIKNEPSPALVEPAPPPTPALPSVLGTVNHPIVLDFDDSVPVKMETCAASGR
ncbi:Fanconi anemia group J protein [Phytophthora boehmeriae]|uniref:Fanconi anemia group J protein n=1 Tax=Phytophthora boehmeriae TaxID=109152 RepID=A0A8T1WU63_9STRA|nr:Fanconi anemia group J protein [Phytophthora boehmeriae]